MTWIFEHLKIIWGYDCVLETRTESKLTLVKILPCYLKLVSLFFFFLSLPFLGVFGAPETFELGRLASFVGSIQKLFL